jgi:pyruvate dehydrogenase E1 component alpha subunit
MVRIRRFEEQLVPVIGSEINCPTHLYTGQEAIACGVCSHLRPEDYVFSNHRSHGHFLAKGGGMRSLMAEMYGRAHGCSGGYGGSMHLAAPEIGLLGSPIIMASSVPLAVGAALAAQSRFPGRVAVSFFGEGVANEGAFYESLNFAALRKLPIVFVCENNLYATHLRVEDCLADTHVDRKAVSMGLPARRIDGNDAIHMYEAAGEAIDAARNGQGPTLLECMTYRWRGHVGPKADIGPRLRTQEELDSWMRRCPIQSLERQLVERGVLVKADIDAVAAAADDEIGDAFAFARSDDHPNPAAMADNVFRREQTTA